MIFHAFVGGCKKRKKKKKRPKAVSCNCTSEGNLWLSVLHLMKVWRGASLQQTIKEPVRSPSKTKNRFLICLRTPQARWKKKGVRVAYMHLDNVDLHWRWQIAKFTRNALSKLWLWAIMVKYAERHDTHSTTTLLSRRIPPYPQNASPPLKAQYSIYCIV